MVTTFSPISPFAQLSVSGNLRPPFGVSPPIDPGDVAKRGGVVMWRNGGAPGYLKQYSGRLSETIEVTCELAMPRWLRAVAGPTKKVTVKAVFIAPEK